MFSERFLIISTIIHAQFVTLIQKPLDKIQIMRDTTHIKKREIEV